jgi:beta-glucosidase
MREAPTANGLGEMAALPPEFMFATGIECSYPTIVSSDGRRVRVDELAKTHHYRHWRTDLALVREMGLRFLRYGPPYYRVHAGPDRYDWEFTDQVFAEMQRLGIVPIVDLAASSAACWRRTIR